MQGVAEFVEQGARIIEGQKRRLALCGGREIHHIDDDRAHAFVEIALAAIARSPGAGALRGAREIIAVEQPHMCTLRVKHLPRPDIRMVDGDIVARRELQAEQALRHVEGCLDHVVELKIRFDLGLFERMGALALLLGVIAPVPGRDRIIGALRPGQGGERIALCIGARHRRLPDAAQQIRDRLRRLRHGVVELVGSVIGIAQKLCPLIAQTQGLAHDGGIVVRGAIAAHGPGAKRLLAQVAALGELQERLDRRARQRDHILPLPQVAIARGAGRRLDQEIGQACDIRLPFQHEREAALVSEHVLREGGTEFGETLRDFRQPRALRLAQMRAGAGEAEMIALDQTDLL